MIPASRATGRYVAFTSDATNLFGADGNAEQDIFVHNMKRGTTRRISVSSADEEADGFSSYASISADGRYVAFGSFAENLIANDANDATDVFVRDRKRRMTVRVSLTNAGAEGDSASEYAFLSSNGRFVAFQSSATNLVGNDTNATTDIYVRGPLGPVARRHEDPTSRRVARTPRASRAGRSHRCRRSVERRAHRSSSAR